jgi:hypothetical protein
MVSWASIFHHEQTMRLVTTSSIKTPLYSRRALYELDVLRPFEVGHTGSSEGRTIEFLLLRFQECVVDFKTHTVTGADVAEMPKALDI